MKSALQPVYSCLTEDEVKRNERGDDCLYIKNTHKGFTLLQAIYTEQIIKDDQVLQLDDTLFGGMGGSVLQSSNNVPDDGTYPSPVRGQMPVYNNKVLCVRFRDQKFSSEFVFPSARLPGAKDPPNVLRPEDLQTNNSNEFRLGAGRGRGRGSGFRGGKWMF